MVDTTAQSPKKASTIMALVINDNNKDDKVNNSNTRI